MTSDVGVAGGISIRGLTFGYGEGTFALSVPELDIAPGEVVACIGPSGCGKTTLLHLIAGILPAKGLRVDGESLDTMDDAARRAFRAERIGFVFQDFGLLAHLSVRENILLPFYVHPGLSLDDAVAGRVAELAHSLGITPHLDRRPERLSQGERQRVALARALITKPRLILADEPTGNLDPETAGQAVDLLLGGAREAGATVVAVTHDHGLLGKFDRVLDAGAWRA